MIFLKYRVLTGLFVIFSFIYLGLTIFLPPDKAALAKYHLDTGQAVLLALTIAIPYLAIWFVALAGYLRLKSYTQAIRRSKDGAAFHTLGIGILLLTLWLPCSAIISNITTGLFHQRPSITGEMIILNNYLNIIFVLPAFWFVNEGARKLLAIVRKSDTAMPQVYLLGSIIFAALYTFLTFKDPVRQVPNDGVTVATYYLPDWLIVTTIIIPRLISWFFGLQAIHAMYLYRTKIKGPVYKAALQNLARGVGVIVGMIIILRCFQSLSPQLNKLGLGALLLIIYLLLVVMSVGYLLIAKGAKNLQKIEEV